MKKRELILLLLFLTALIYAGIVYSQGSSTGVFLNIVDTTGPSISLLGIINNSAFIHGNASFPFNATDSTGIGNCSMIFNDKINFTNKSISEGNISKFELFNLEIGRFNFSINCTDTLDFVQSLGTFTFTVNRFTEFNGSSTDITQIDNRNITNFVAEITSLGKINFSQSIDLSQGFDLDKYINISSNRIELNSTSLQQLNKSATLSLYGLTFDNPRVLKDGALCPAAICTEVPPYSNGVFVFNVTHFSVYSAEETPSDGGDSGGTGGGTSGGGGGGGGGGAIRAAETKVSDFAVDKRILKVILRQGQTKEETINIRNTGEETLDITTYLEALRQFILSPSSNEISVTLNPNEDQTLNLFFGAGEDQKPDVYTGKINIKSGTIERAINAIVEVESARPLFDVDVEVLPEYKSLFAGQDIFIEVSLFNVRGFGRVDVVLEYSLIDFEGNLIAKEEETVAVETQAKFVRELLVPSDLKPGTYVASVKVTFEESVGISSDLFEVKAKTIRLYPIAIKDYTPYLFMGLIFLISVAVFLYFGLGLSKKPLPKTKEEETKLIKTEEKARKFEKELLALQKAYKSKFISEKSYAANKERIETALKNLRK